MTAPRPEASGSYLRELLDVDFTAEQLACITAPFTPQLVTAGAGSGKTMVMAARVVHAVAFHRVPPAQILGLTFTNKAAGELAERVRRCLARLPRAIAEPGIDDVDPYDDVPTVATYHSYAATLVRDHALRIGREPGATLMSEAVQWQLAMRVATRATGPFAHLNWTTPYVANLVVLLAGDLADHLAEPDAVRRHDERVRAEIGALPKPLKPARDIIEQTLARDELLGLVAAYDAEKSRLDLIDFGDQVALACRIVAAAPEVAALERRRFSVVVLDEYQDTGVAQRILLSALFGDGHPVTAVGDANQSIYGWRGASLSNITRYDEHFPTRAGHEPRARLTLATSFRCDGRILAAANRIAEPLAESLVRRGGSDDGLILSARPGAEDAGEVLVSRPLTAIDEAEALAQRIVDAHSAGTRYGEIAVLARRRMDFARLHRTMVERDIPVEVVGLGGLLAMPEVSDIVAVLALLNDVTANASAVRLLTGPRWRIGVRDLAALGARADRLARLRPFGPGEPSAPTAEAEAADGTEVADEQAVAGHLDDALEAATASVDPVEVPSLLEAAESPGSAALSMEARERLGRFVAEIRRLRTLAGQPIVDVIAEVVRSSGLDVEIEATDAALAVARLANVHSFLDVAAHFSGLEGESDLGAFLAFLRAASENEDGLDIASGSDADTVKLMTVHAAKGLEWDVVAIPGLVSGVFPSDRGRRSWTSAAHVLPFACRGDGADLPVLTGYANADIDAFKQACTADAADEERRLAYVAMTRARHRLWLSGYVWSETRRERMKPSTFLEQVQALGAPTVTVDDWCDDPDDDAVNDLVESGHDDIPWPVTPDPVRLERRRAAAAMVVAAAGAEPAELGGTARVTAEGWWRDAGLMVDEARRRRRTTIDVTLPARLTTSQVVSLSTDPDGFAGALARPMPSRPVAQAKRGSRFHRWVEQLYGAAPLLEPDDLPGAEDADVSDLELADLQQRFLADGWGERRPVAVESPFEMVIGGRLVRGRIDAVYREADGGYDVIDYKTGSVPRDFASAALQLAIYRLAWADLAAVEPSNVRAGFLYVRTGELKRPDRLLDRDQLAALLSAP